MTFTNMTLLISKGSAPNLVSIEVLHMTTNANGVVTSNVEASLRRLPRLKSNPGRLRRNSPFFGNLLGQTLGTSFEWPVCVADRGAPPSSMRVC